MSDPRAANCQAYHLDANGQVDGVKLVYVPDPTTRYELIRAELIDEAAAGGSQVATCVVLDEDGIQTAERVWLAWEFPDLKAGWGLPGNPNGQHIISNGYPAASGKVGPLALYVGDGSHNPTGDIIGGVGLPDNRHVSYRMTWRERTTAPIPTPGTDGELLTEILARVQHVEAQNDDILAAIRSLRLVAE